MAVTSQPRVGRYDQAYSDVVGHLSVPQPPPMAHDVQGVRLVPIHPDDPETGQPRPPGRNAPGGLFLCAITAACFGGRSRIRPRSLRDVRHHATSSSQSEPAVGIARTSFGKPVHQRDAGQARRRRGAVPRRRRRRRLLSRRGRTAQGHHGVARAAPSAFSLSSVRARSSANFRSSTDCRARRRWWRCAPRR